MRQTTEPIHATREREIGLIFLRAKQTRTQSGGAKQHAGTAIDSALSNGRGKEEECGTCCSREGRDASGRPFSAPRFNSHPSKTLARSRFRSWPLRRVYTYAAAELFKNSVAPPPPWPSLAKREIWVLCDASNATLTASSALVPPAPAPARSPYSVGGTAAIPFSSLPLCFLWVKIGIACWRIHREPSYHLRPSKNQ